MSPRDAAWLARILRVEDTRRDEPLFLDSLLQHGQPVARARAALAAGRIGARGHVAALRQHTADPDTAVAATAWFSLALLRDSGAVSMAGRALRGPATVAIEAARLLGDVGEAGRAGIITGLGDSTLDPAVRAALLLAAARLRPVPATAVVPWVASSDTGVAWRAAYVLARGRSSAGTRTMLSAARSPSAGVREQAARGLARAVAGDSLGDSALVALRLLATDSVPRVRANAVRTLSSYGARARRELTTALRDPDAGVRVTAAQSLGAVFDSSAAGWADAFTADTLLVFRQAVAEGAAAHGVTLAGAASWRTSPDWRYRAASVALAARGRAEEAATSLRAWRGDRDSRVRTTAVAALATLMDSATARDSVRGALREALADRDPFVRAAALGGLASGASIGDLALALDAYTAHLADRDPDARLAFWQLADSALARAGAALPESLVSRLSTLSRPADPLERIAAARIPRFAAWADSTGTARPLAWYRARAREVIRRPTRSALLQTARGTMRLTLFAWDAPLTVYNFTSLAQRHYFDGQRFHRVVPNFVIQAGDPRGDGNGGPGYAIRDEINRHRYGRGVLGMALSGPDTGGSQWFVTHSPQPHLDGGYTIFGELQSGASVLDQIVQGDRIVRITVR
ncbi:MAG TPA: peptidylprolyl isomerase [Gemmatimonadaceae bacterium]|nr:peptidylprolyl isomerase [Gemmatimonadaceae bacterium]